MSQYNKKKQGPLFTTSGHLVAIIYVHWCIETVTVENDNGGVTGCSHVMLLFSLGTRRTQNETNKKKLCFWMILSSEFGIISYTALDEEKF